MALANFFHRAATAASHVLRGFDPGAFSAELEKRPVGVAFDAECSGPTEAAVTLELLVNLLARLYPKLTLVPMGEQGPSVHRRLASLARSIHPEVELGGSADDLATCVVVGGSPIRTRCPTYYIGSDGWLARLSDSRPVGSGRTANPFGASAAACFGAANVFRTLFGASLPGGGKPDTQFALSTFNYRFSREGQNPKLPETALGECHLVGLGAIGNAAVWTMKRAKVSGELHLIDHEGVELSNLQRYVLTTQQSVSEAKVHLAKSYLRGSGLTVRAHEATWAQYVAASDGWHFDRVAVALDSVRDRRGVQASLPRWIVNAWTQPWDLGVSRHAFVGEHACLACLYQPTGKEPDFDELVAAAVGLPGEKMKIRQLLYDGSPVDRAILEQIAAASCTRLESLLPFEGTPLREFYQRAVCGSAVLGVRDPSGVARGAEVPMAFQSALAGVLLAGELVADAAKLKSSPPPVTTRINLLGPVSELTSFAEKKMLGCFCQDPDFVDAYRVKYKRANDAPRTMSSQ